MTLKFLNNFLEFDDYQLVFQHKNILTVKIFFDDNQIKNPKEISELFMLKNLNLENFKSTSIPKEIGSLNHSPNIRLVSKFININSQRKSVK